MTKDIPSFQQYQQAFTAYLRDPVNQPRPENVVAKRMDVYKEIVFNNLFDSVSACFPVSKKVMGKRAWLKLIREFFREHSANTPIYRKIPEEFIAYLSQINLPSINKVQVVKVPPYLVSLCHYEWIELLVSTMVDSIDEATSRNQAVDLTGELLENQVVFVPTMQLLNYEYAVHKISPRHKPKDKISTQLLVYRHADDVVKFIELNPVTYRLIELLQQKNTSSKKALTTIANELGHADPKSVIQFGLEILNDLRNQGVIRGVYSNAT